MPIKNPPHPVAGADLLRLLDWMQRSAAREHSIAQQVHRELADPLHRELTLVLSGDELRVFGQNKHELHRPFQSPSEPAVTLTTPPHPLFRH